MKNTAPKHSSDERARAAAMEAAMRDAKILEQKGELKAAIAVHQVAHWNFNHPVGTRVVVYEADATNAAIRGRGGVTLTTGEAFREGTEAVVSVEGRNYAVDLLCVVPLSILRLKAQFMINPKSFSVLGLLLFDTDASVQLAGFDAPLGEEKRDVWQFLVGSPHELREWTFGFEDEPLKDDSYYWVERMLSPDDAVWLLNRMRRCGFSLHMASTSFWKEWRDSTCSFKASIVAMLFERS